METLSFKDHDEKLNSVKSCALELIALLIVFAGFSGALSSMLGASPLFMLVSGAAVLIACVFLKNVKRRALIITGTCATVSGVLFAAFAKNILNGAKSLLNNLYALSEKAQPYKYEMFSVNEEYSKTGQMLALIILGIIISGLLALIPSKAKAFASFSLCAAIIIMCIYFAVLPSVVFLMLMIIGSVLMIAFETGGKAITYSVPIVLCAIVLLPLFTAIVPQSKSVSDFGDSMRDKLAPKTVYVSGVTVETVKQEELEKQERQNKEERRNEEQQKRFDPRVLVAIIIVALISAVLLFISKLFERLNLRRDENKKDIDASDNARAVTAMFRYCVRLLKAYGAEDGINFSKLKIPLNENYKSEYRKMNALFNEAAFSNHKISDSCRAEMLQFMNETKETINEKSSLKQKLLIKYRYAL